MQGAGLQGVGLPGAGLPGVWLQGAGLQGAGLPGVGIYVLGIGELRAVNQGRKVTCRGARGMDTSEETLSLILADLINFWVPWCFQWTICLSYP